MSTTQVVMLAGMFIIQCCIIVGFGVAYLPHIYNPN